jgi:hypothetical protein
VGLYNQAFWFDNLETFARPTFGQGVFIIYSLVQHKINVIYYVGNLGSHYQKSRCQDVVFVTN